MKSGWPFVAIVAAICAICLIASLAHARDDGRYASSTLHEWFNGLSAGGSHVLCCPLADGRTVEDPDWGDDGSSFWVVVDGKKYRVPSDAVVTVPNKFGRAVVWPYSDSNGTVQIRCFMPGAGA